MGFFSFAGKTKQDTVSKESEFYSHAEEESNNARRRTKRKQNPEPSDPVLPEKKRARRRLVGAIALVLAAVIGLPMILDSEPKPLASDIAIEIPSKDKVAAQASTSPANSTPTDALSPDASLDKDEEIIDPSDKELAPVTPPVKRPESGEQTSQAGTVRETQEAKSISKKTESSPDEERARALLEGRADPKADKPTVVSDGKVSDGKNGKFVIQIAALASQDKVNELQNKLKSAGIKSYTSKVATQSGERIRVRVGPFGSKEEAEKVRARLVKLGLGGTLVPV